MILSETVSFDKEGHLETRSVFRRYFLAFLFILVSILSFGLGRFVSMEEARGTNITYDESLSAIDTTRASTTTPNIKSTTLKAVGTVASGSGEVTASSKGTRYYYPGCSNTISAKNKISFATASMAEAAGYSLAATCKPH